MNNTAKSEPVDELFLYQVRRLRELIQEVLQCCQTQTEFLSRKFEMPKAELRCLLLFQGERYLTVKIIAQKLDVAKSRVTKIVDGLMKKRMVESTDDPNDGRVKLIRLTPLGHSKCDEMGRYIGNTHERLLLEIDAERRKTVISSLDQLRVGMEAVKKTLM